MITGDEYVNLALKRFLSNNKLKDNFLDYLLDGQREHVSRIFPEQGLFTYPVTMTKTVGGVVNFTTDPATGTDGEGHILEASGSDLTNLTIPNSAAPGAHEYWFALHYCEVPSGVYLNPRTGLPEYDRWKEEIGLSGTPTSVVDNVTFLTIDVTSITSATVDYSGFEVSVWLNNPQGTTEAVAIETITITNPSGANIIVTTGLLGQSTVSTTASDYTVCFRGIYWEDAGVTPAGNPFASDYCILGHCLGGAVITTVISNQVDLSGGGGHTLQRAYDGTGSGAGRHITPNNEAVELTQINTGFFNKDIAQAAMRFDKDGDSSTFQDDFRDYENCIDIKGRIQSWSGVLYRALLVDESGSGELQKDETVSIGAAGNTITGTRVGRDFTLTSCNGKIIDDYDLIELTGTTNNDDDGLYLIDAVTAATTIDVKNLDGTAVSFTQDSTGIASIYRPVARLGGGNGDMSAGLHIVTLGDFNYEHATPAAQNDGGISITIPDNAEDDDEIIVTNKLVSLDSFLVTADANVHTTADYKYNAAKTFYRQYGPAHINFDTTYGAYTVGSPDFINISADPGGNTFAWIELVDIPDGATITLVELMVKDSGVAGGEIIYYVNRANITWGVGSEVVAKNSISGPHQSAGAGALEDVTTGAISSTIDTSAHAYYISITSNVAAGTAVNGVIYGARVTYTTDTLQP